MISYGTQCQHLLGRPSILQLHRWFANGDVKTVNSEAATASVVVVVKLVVAIYQARISYAYYTLALWKHRGLA
jgi:hypothetical protein